MKKEMRTLYIEVLATHDGPEPCVGPRESGGEASVGVHAGQLLSREINIIQGADAVPSSGRQHRRRRFRESPGTLRGRRT